MWKKIPGGDLVGLTLNIGEAAGDDAVDLARRVNYDPLFLSDVMKYARGRSKTITIDPLNKFHPGKFFGKGHSIIHEEVDPRSVALTSFNIDHFKFPTMKKDGENSITIFERLKRLKETNCCLPDLRIFLTLWNHPFLFPEEWKKYIIYFDGIPLWEAFDKRRVALLIIWDNDGKRWHWSTRGLNNTMQNERSIVLDLNA